MESILRQAGINSLDWDIENNILYLSQVSGLPKPAGAAELGKNVSIQVIEHFSETAKNWNVVSGEHREDFLRYISRVYQNRDNTGLSCEF